MNTPAHKHKTMGLPLLLLTGLLYFWGLQLFGAWIMSWLVMAQPYYGSVQDAIARVIPIPWLFLAAPFVLAVIIIFFSRNARDRGFFEGPRSAAEEEGSGGFFKASYSYAHLRLMLKWITFWVVAIFAVRLMFWFAFQSYMH